MHFFFILFIYLFIYDFIAKCDSYLCIVSCVWLWTIWQKWQWIYIENHKWVFIKSQMTRTWSMHNYYRMVLRNVRWRALTTKEHQAQAQVLTACHFDQRTSSVNSAVPFGRLSVNYVRSVTFDAFAISSYVTDAKTCLHAQNGHDFQSETDKYGIFHRNRCQPHI